MDFPGLVKRLKFKRRSSIPTGYRLVCRENQKLRQRLKELKDKYEISENAAAQRTKELAELLRANENFKEAQRLAHIGNWNWDVREDIVTWSEEIYRIAGWKPGTPPPNLQRHKYFLTSESWNVLENTTEQCLHSGIPFEIDLELKHPDGGRRWIISRGAAEKKADGSVHRLYGTVQDISYRKKTEEERDFRNALLTAQQETSIDGILVVDSRRRVISYNQRFVDMWGIAPGVIQTGSSEKLVESILEKLANPREFTERLNQLYCHPGEKSDDEIPLSDGTIFERHTSPVKGSDGTYYGRVWYFRDVTKRRKDEATLRNNEAQLRQIIDLVPNKLFIKDWDGRFILLNKAHEYYYGAKIDHLTGMYQKDIHPDPSEIQMMLENDREVIATGKTKVMSEQVFTDVWGNKHILHVTKVPFNIIEGRQRAVLGIAVDITDIKHAENALKESEARLKEAQKIAHIGSWNWDVPSDTVTWSEEMYHIVGIPPHLPAPSSLEHKSLLPAESWERYMAVVENTLKTGGQFEVELEFYRPGGEHRWIVSRGVAVRDNKGAVTRIHGTVQDITGRKTAEEALQRAYNVLEIHNRQLEFTSRELKEAIAEKNVELAERRRVAQELHLLTERIENVREEERTSIAREIHDELGQHITTLKYNVMALQMSLSPQAEPVKEILNSMVELLNSMIFSVQRISSDLRPRVLDDLGIIEALKWLAHEFRKRTGIECSYRFPREEIFLESRISTALFRICQEALTNVARHAKASAVVITANIRESQVVVKVKDNGTGISMKESSAPLSFGIKGIKERVHLLGGGVEIRGIARKGTTIEVTLPLVSKKDNEREAPREVTDNPFS